MGENGVESKCFDSAVGVTLVGGGPAFDDELRQALTLAPTCVAADGGADLAVSAQVPVQALFGDFDSVSPQALLHVPTDRHFRIREQETTDFDKALRCIRSPLIVAVGFSGGRMDHQLAAFHTLLRHPHQRCIVLTQTQIVLAAPPKLCLPTLPGDIVSIFPLGATTGRSSGLKWPIDGLTLDPMTRIGTSNLAEGPATIEMDTPTALLILPRRLIRHVAHRLTQPDAVGWPPRAEQYIAL